MAALGRHQFPHFVIASSVSSVARRSKRSPRRILKSTSIFSICLPRACATRIKLSQRERSCRSKAGSRAALLDLAKAFGNEVGGGRVVIRQKLSQSDVAAMAGIARENVSRILNEWMRLKLITRLSGYYCVESKAKLEKEMKL